MNPQPDGDPHAEELKELREIWLNQSVVSEPPKKKLPALVTADVVDYDVRKGKEFRNMKESFLDFFEDKLIRGAVLVYAEEQGVQKLAGKKIGTICENYNKGCLEILNSSSYRTDRRKIINYVPHLHFYTWRLFLI